MGTRKHFDNGFKAKVYFSLLPSTADISFAIPKESLIISELHS